MNHKILIEKDEPESLLNGISKIYFNDLNVSPKNNNVSSWIQNYIAVPQLSVLGPLIFIIYMADFLSNIKNGITSQFADGSTVVVTNNFIQFIKFLLNLISNELFIGLVQGSLLFYKSKILFFTSS